MKIVGISGEAHSGKDTAYDLLFELLHKEDKGATKLSFASKLKDICSNLFYWDREKLDFDVEYKEGDTILAGDTKNYFKEDGNTVVNAFEKVPDPACKLLGKTRRQVMQEVGTEAMRNGLHKDVWIIALQLAIDNGEYDDFDYGFITDCRFINELEFVRNMNGIIIRIENPENESTIHNQHASETEWKQWDDWDVVVTNHIDHEDKYRGMRQFSYELGNKVLPLIL